MWRIPPFWFPNFTRNSSSIEFPLFFSFYKSLKMCNKSIDYILGHFLFCWNLGFLMLIISNLFFKPSAPSMSHSLKIQLKCKKCWRGKIPPSSLLWIIAVENSNPKTANLYRNKISCPSSSLLLTVFINIF